jgi:hypothetical protein
MNDTKPQTRRVLDACRPDIKHEPHPLAAHRRPAQRLPAPRAGAPTAHGTSPVRLTQELAATA